MTKALTIEVGIFQHPTRPQLVIMRIGRTLHTFRPEESACRELQEMLRRAGEEVRLVMDTV